MIKHKVAEELKRLIEENIDPSMFPYCKGNSIRIGKIIIRENRHGFNIYDMKEKQQITCTFSKTAAVAIAKNLAKGQDVIDRVLILDKIIEKNFTDAVFYAHIVRTTKDEVKRDISEVTLDIAKAKTEDAKDHLDYLIF